MPTTRMTTSEARKDLARVVSQVKKGVNVILSRHDKPVVVMISIEEWKRFRALEDQNDLQAARAADQETEELAWDDIKGEYGL